ncbi:DUF4870 domain-containing protein [Oceanobacillus saliphilus]|uniref:DUF4870 domain-containing protein n=1 Tax=Oceanobacillus saliphilus TaxID=2925834 RepID=UPI00201E25F1|nr:DUF4870 domain-containing protein [Oceanobacillus saliphilus]
MTSSDDRLFAMLIYVLSFPFPILGPLLIWLLKREDSEFVDYHGKEYFNFFVSYFIFGAIASILVILVVGIILLIIIGIMAFVLTIIAAVKSYQGERYRFPFIFHFIK